MLSSFRLAGLIIVLFAICGPARAQELAPTGTGVSVHKLAIDSANSHTVKYIVTGGSHALKALVRRVEWAENEVTIIEELQLIKLDIVSNERRVQAHRTAQLGEPFPAPGSSSGGGGGFAESSLMRGLSDQLASEATPEAAMKMIGMLEQLQEELDAKLKTLPPQEKKAAEGPIAALRPRVDALARAKAASPPRQPDKPERRDQTSPRAPAGAKAAVEVEWNGTWYAAEALRVSGGSTLIHYKGYDSSWDEWVPASRIRRAGAASARPPTSTPDFVLLQQTMREQVLRPHPQVRRWR